MRESTRKIQRVDFLYGQRGRPTRDEPLAYASKYTKVYSDCLATQYFREPEDGPFIDQLPQLMSKYMLEESRGVQGSRIVPYGRVRGTKLGL
jgi:hypothetical protein